MYIHHLDITLLRQRYSGRAARYWSQRPRESRHKKSSVQRTSAANNCETPFPETSRNYKQRHKQAAKESSVQAYLPTMILWCSISQCTIEVAEKLLHHEKDNQCKCTLQFEVGLPMQARVRTEHSNAIPNPQSYLHDTWYIWYCISIYNRTHAFWQLSVRFPNGVARLTTSPMQHGTHEIHVLIRQSRHKAVAKEYSISLNNHPQLLSVVSTIGWWLIFLVYYPRNTLWKYLGYSNVWCG